APLRYGPDRRPGSSPRLRRARGGPVLERDASGALELRHQVVRVAEGSLQLRGLEVSRRAHVERGELLAAARSSPRSTWARLDTSSPRSWRLPSATRTTWCLSSRAPDASRSSTGPPRARRRRGDDPGRRSGP